ncbi:hypothetical protein QFC24_002979 [Naganishia onofrii]|uniref:Uncharacterized protein n=1 Tax=Naganishia onofrii TaxID=1851511 RepID=A0ACC2XN63_9TREE|nr:hypothetical protein QFC24_002979 [Naganishia onofrii]
MLAEQSDGSFIDHRHLNKFHLRLPQDEAARRIVQCIVQLVDPNNLQVDQTIRLQVRDKRKQWMRGEIRILDGAYGEESTLVEVVKTGVSLFSSVALDERSTNDADDVCSRVPRAIHWNGGGSFGS